MPAQQACQRLLPLAQVCLQALDLLFQFAQLDCRLLAPGLDFAKTACRVGYGLLGGLEFIGGCIAYLFVASDLLLDVLDMAAQRPALVLRGLTLRNRMLGLPGSRRRSRADARGYEHGADADATHDHQAAEALPCAATAAMAAAISSGLPR